MAASEPAGRAASRRALAGRSLRYAVVSAVNVPAVQVVILLLQVLAGLEGWVANLVAVAVSTGPAYLASKRWVWRRSGDVGSAPAAWFWTFSVGGLLLSTAAIYGLSLVVDRLWLANVVNLATYGSLFVARFLVLERLLHRSTT